MLAGVTWGVGGGLAAVAGAMMPATTAGFISPITFDILIIGALATALLGGFRSYPLALLGGVFLGVAQSLATHWSNDLLAGQPPAGRPRRRPVPGHHRGPGHPRPRPPAAWQHRRPAAAVGTGRIRPGVVLVVAAAALLWVGLAASTDWYAPTVISATFAVVGLSVVVLTGYTGQLSLAQYALAGIGAFAAAKLVAAHGWRFEPALLAGVLVAMAIGFVFGLPALRTRGVNLAVVTFGLGFAVLQLVFSNSSYTENARVQPTGL